MPNQPPDPSAANQHLDEVVTAYLKAAESGEARDQQAWLTRYPELASELAAFFAGHNQVEKLAAPLQQVSASDAALHDAPTLSPTPTPLGTPSTKICYFGDYELLDEIARGGMGVVYRARQVSLNRIVALKMILTGQLAAAEDVARFHREAEAAANLDHPNIVPIYEVGEHEGQHYFSMKLIEGGSLAQRGASDKERGTSKEGQRKAAELVATIARAVHHAHQRGILHRDLKPSNILLDANGQPHVTDFGLARRVEGDPGHTRTGNIVGTPSYMPPEQARSETVLTTAVDVYGLGAILYELLTGRPPFRAETALDTVLQVLDCEPERPGKLNPRIDTDLETVCLHCLEKDPAKRYGSAEALAEDLGHWHRGEPIKARPSAAWKRALKWAKRKPMAAGLVGVSVFATLFMISALVVANILVNRALRNETQAKSDLNESLDQAQRTAYQRSIGFAHSEWRANNILKTEDLLDQCAPRLRKWEWHYLKRLCHADVLTFHGHAPGAAPENIMFTPDGKQVISGGRSILAWDAATGQITRILGENEFVSQMAFSADSQLLVASELNLEKERWTSHLKAWQTATGKRPTLFPDFSGLVSDLAFCVDNRHVLSANHDNTISMWDVSTGHKGATFDFGEYVDRLAICPEGGLAALQLRSGPIEIVEIASGKEVRILGKAGPQANCMVFSPDGRNLATARTGIAIWEVNTGKPLVSFGEKQTDEILSLAYRPDGQLLASAGPDRTVRLWDVNTGQETMTLRGHTGSISRVIFNSDGNRLATASRDGTVKIWDPKHYPECVHLQGLCGPMAICPVGDILACQSGNHDVLVVDRKTLQIRQCFSEEGNKLPWEITSLCFGGDGKFLAASRGAPPDENEGAVRVWDVRTGRTVLHLRNLPGKPRSVALSPDSRRLAAVVGGSDVQEIRIWDVLTGKELIRCPASSTMLGRTLEFAPNGRYLVSVFSPMHPLKSNIKIWNVESGALERTLEGHSEDVCRAVYSPDGQLLVTAGVSLSNSLQDSHELILWDANTGQELRRFLGHTKQIQDATFAPDGKSLASISQDGTLRLWNLLDAQELLVLPDAGEQLGFTPDGEGLIVVRQNELYLLDGSPLPLGVAGGELR